MARGKRSAQVNAGLRSQLDESTRQVGKLERRIQEIEAERDELAGRLSALEAQGHPAVAEAEARVRAADERAHLIESKAKGELLTAFDIVITGWRRRAESLGQDLNDGWLLSEDEIGEIRRLGGDTLLTTLFDGSPLNRNARRLLASGGTKVTGHLKLAGRVMDL